MPRIGQGATSGVLNGRASANPNRIHAGRRTISVATTTGKRRNSNAVSRTKPVATLNDSSRMNNVASRTKPVAIQNGSSRNSSAPNISVSGNSNGNSKTNSDNRSSNVVSRSARLNNSGAITTTSVDATKPIAGSKIRIGVRKSSAARTTRIANGIGNSASKTSNEGISTSNGNSTASAVRT